MVCCSVDAVLSVISALLLLGRGGSICPNQMGCSWGSAKACDSFVVFSASSPFQSLMNISKLFSLDIGTLAYTNKIPLPRPSDSGVLGQGQRLLIPLRCQCNNQYYEIGLGYQIENEQRRQTLSKALDGLLGCDLPDIRNPGNTQQEVRLSLKCGCPTMDESKQGFKYLMTYPVLQERSVDKIAQTFGVSTNDILKASGLNSFGPFVRSLEVPLRSTPVLSKQPQQGTRGNPNPGNGNANPAFRTPNTPYNPTPRNPYTTRPLSQKKKSSPKVGLIIGIIFGVIVLIGAVAGAIFFKRKQKEKNKEGPQASHEEARTDLPPLNIIRTIHTVENSSEISKPSKKSSHLEYCWKPDQIIKATENFSRDYRIGGSVYHAILHGTPVAIKKTRREISELFNVYKKVHHPHLIKLLGICNGDVESYLILEFAENGSLSDWLHGGLAIKNSFIQSSSRFLTWKQRLLISLDVATAVQYIHTHNVQSCCIHKGINSATVLLSADFRAKIAHYWIPEGPEVSDPERAAYMRKTDVSAFGALLVEIVSGKRPSNLGFRVPTAKDLKDWVDPSLNEDYSAEQAMGLLDLARSCFDQEEAVSMAYVLSRLSTLIDPSSSAFSE